MTYFFIYNLMKQTAKSTLTFNITVTDRDNLMESNEPFQIMPVQKTPILDSTILTYNEAKEEKQILIHTSYITKLWKAETYIPQSKQKTQIENYCKLARRLKTKYILVHGPYSYDEFGYYTTGLCWLKNIANENKDITFCIEIPSFTKSAFENVKVDLQLIEDYFQLAINSGFQIVIDTAHLFANGIDVDNMIYLLDKFRDSYDWIHLNGNVKPMFSSDKHTIITGDDNKIKDPEKLLGFISTLNKFCVCEIVFRDEKYWKELAKKYGFELVSERTFNLMA